MATIAPTKTAPPASGNTVHRTSIAEWAVTILILLFGTSMIAQPFVIPTSSMHNTLLTGDHLIVDKLAYAPAGSISQHILPYEDVKRGDIIVFRHPTLIVVDYVKRVI
jgi:signal peptidase I